MDPNIIERRRRSRLWHIGMELVRGPRSLIPPRELDDFGWLEPALHMMLWPADTHMRESVAIFTDDTMNRDKDFLKPLIRHVLWERSRDMRNPPDWPSVDIQLSYFEEHREWVDNQIKALQTALAHAPFIPFGLTARRDGPNMVANDDPEDFRGWFEICSENGVQTITLRSPDLGHGDRVTELFFELFSGLVERMQPIPRAGWKETYNSNLNVANPWTSWDWDYEVPSPHVTNQSTERQ